VEEVVPIMASITERRADAAVVTGRIAGYAGGCLENANNAATANNPVARTPTSRATAPTAAATAALRR
jgi:hypothetical protein